MVEMSDVMNLEHSFEQYEHRELARGIEHIHVAATSVWSRRSADISASIRSVRNWMSTVMAPHAAWEDAVLYPEIEGRTGTDWSTKFMRFQHYQIERAATQLDIDIELLQGTPTGEQISEIHGHLAGLEALLRAHIELEECFLVPLLAH